MRSGEMDHQHHAGHGEHGGHGAHGGHGDHAAQFRDRFWLSLLLTIPIVIYSEMVQEWLGFTPPQFPGSQWVAPVLGAVVFLYGGRPFLEGGLAELRSRQPGMMLLISLAILVAFGASVATVFGAFDLEFWWELSLLIVIMLLGHWLEMRAQALADRAAALLFYFAVGAGLITMAVWLALGEPDQAVERTVTVLVIACPHALGLAIPLVIAIATGLAAHNGILVKDRLAVERMRTVDTVLFDKTGTLTKGEPIVSRVAAVDGDQDRLLRLAAAVEADSEHPLARAIVAAAATQAAGERPAAGGFRSMTGRGVQATVDGAAVAVGGPALLRELAVTEPEVLAEQVSAWKRRGATVLYVGREGKGMGALSLEDAVRPESRQAVSELHRLGRRVVMITGDAHQVAEAVAADLGVD